MLQLIVFSVGLTVSLLISPPGMAAEAASMDELVAMYDDADCAGCHEEIYTQWKDSWHSRAVVSSLGGLRNFIAVGLAKEWRKPLTKSEILKCLDCHAPVVNFAGEQLAADIGKMIVTAVDHGETPEGQEALRELARLNVGCSACHNIKAVAVARSLRGEPRQGVLYGPRGSDIDAHTSIGTGDISRSVFCMQCHGKYKAPDGDTIQCNTLSGSYQNAYINLGGTQTCQDCHMRQGHLFPGGQDADMVREGLGFRVEMAAYRHLPGLIAGVKEANKWVPSVVVNAFVTNNAGHRIPDG